MELFKDGQGHSAISRAVTGVIIIVVLVVAGVGVYFATTTSGPSSTTSTTTTSTTMTTTTSTTTTTSPPSSNRTLVIDDYASPSPSLNELNVITFSPYPDWPETAVYQTLVNINATAQQKDDQIQILPGLATSWNVSSDGETYTFSLRPNVQFSNGDPFNAYQVWAEFYILYDLSGNFSSFWQGAPIFDMSNVQFGPATMAVLNASGLSNPSSDALKIMQNTNWPVYVTGPETIVFHMKVPFQFFLQTCTGWTDFIMDSQYIILHGGPGSPGSPNPYFNFANFIPGTGPYYIAKYVAGQYAIFKQWSGYWGNALTPAEIAANPFLDPGHYSQIVIYTVPDQTTSYLDLNSGKSQISFLSSSNLELALASPSNYGVMTLKYPAGSEYLWFNTAWGPTNNTLVRQAIVHAINYTEILQTAAHGLGVPFMGPEVPIFGSYYDPGNYPVYSQNLTLAAQELAQAGYPGGKGLPTLPLVIIDRTSYWELPAADIIQQNLAQIGISVNIEVQTLSYEAANFGSYTSEYAVRSSFPAIQLSYSAYSPDYMAPTDYWTVFVTTFSSFGNFAIYNNTIVDNAVRLMYSSNNQTLILQNLKLAQEQIYNDAPYAWMFVPTTPVVDGTYVWKAGVIGGFYAEPNLEGVTDLPALNTIFPGPAA